MPVFKINEIYKIAGRGQVLSGKIIGNGFVFSGDKIRMLIENKYYTFNIIGVNAQKDSDHYGLMISINDFNIISNFELTNEELLIINTSKTI